jgi:hypothetical protein
MWTGQPLMIAKNNRDMMNDGRISERNSLVSDDFFAVFSFGNEGEVETYHAEQYRQGNVEAHEFYLGKNPHWHYADLHWGMRSDNEFVVSSTIDFTLNSELVMKALVMEVYRFEDGYWRLLRQFMEKFRP